MGDIEIVIIRRAKMDRKTKKRVDANRAAGMCISCGLKKPYKRETCVACHGRYINHMPRTNKKTRAQYEAGAIAAGKIGESRQGQRGPNWYKDFSAKVESGQ